MDYKKSFTDATKATMKNGGKDIATKVVPVILAHLDSIDYYNNHVPITLEIAEEYYSIDQLIKAYKKKMTYSQRWLLSNGTK